MKLSIRHLAIAAALALTLPAAAQSCTGDILADGVINGADLGAMLSYWGPRTTAPFSVASDLNGDGVINGGDIGLLLSNWGTCPAPTWATVLQAQPNPAVVTDPVLRDAIHATGLPWRVRDTRTGIEMLLVPPGTFQMGCVMGSNEWGCFGEEQPVHQVTLTSAFYIGRYELTQAQWVEEIGSNPSNYQGYVDSASRPVEQVSWTSIQGYLTATGMRLPTEAEWEYACRAGTQTPFYNGSMDDNTLGALAWYGGNSGSQTRPVGGKAANGFGLHDMLGNVFEWVNDWYDSYPSNSQTNPTGPVLASTRAVRGGCIYNISPGVRSSSRIDGAPDFSNFGLGFRVARNP